MTAGPPHPHTTTVVVAGRNWPLLFLLGLATFTGYGVLTDPGRALPYMSRHLPPIVPTAWGVCLLVGGAVAFAGAAMAVGVTALLIERAGLLILGGICLSYPTALMFAAGAAALERSVTILLFAVVVLGRAVQITHVLGFGARRPDRGRQ